ncbi:MAG: NIPSNAP family protein [Dehalococcoidia bacterium]
MTAALTYQLRPIPGKADEFFADLQKGSAVGEKYGGKVRWFQSQVAGPNSGTVIVTTEFADLAALGAAMEKANADPDWQAVLAKGQSANASATILGVSILSEIPRG